ncbi:TonB-dependent siderophore receptor [Undibacterium sp. TS12]|uniref:TonB-dependent receptor n=1 Tax=Undibacterium sp. TS12 TaxID=2908202 RepID=UPI001F4CCBE0|nr:TonB-dependent siderophore receptor [Undibacterium sp. TS12]MCH8619575.1 TonB-dependent siderophore receptor [Undibacterium sp. TS12]
MQLKPIALLVTSLFTCATTSVAQEKNELPVIEVKAQQTGGGALVSGALKNQSSLLETPQSISVVQGEDLRARLANTSKDALEYSSGVIAGQGEGRRDEFYLRGFYSPRETLLDGVRDDSLYYRDLATTERLEIIKGASGALYGRGSAGGLINRVSKKPQAKQDTELSLGLGSDRQRRLAIDAGGALSEQVNGRLIAAYDAGNSYRDVVDHTRLLLAPSLAWNLAASTSLLLQAEIQREDHTPDRGIPAINGRAVDVPVATFYGEKFDFTKTDSDMFKARLEHKFNGQLSLVNTLQYSQTDLDGVNTRNRRVNADKTVSRQITYFPIQQKNLINQTELSYALQNQLILVGLELAQQKRDSLVRQTGTAFPVDLYHPQQVLAIPDFKTLPAAIDSRFDADTAALYLQDQISVTSKLDILLGARFDQFKQKQTNRLANNAVVERTDHLFSPRLGLVYKITPQQSVYANVSRSHQPAGGDLLYTGTTALSQVKPLQTNLQELGLKQDWLDKRLYTSVALFRIEQSNQLTADPTDSSGLRQLQIGRQRNQGIEVELQAQLGSATQVNASYSYNDAKIIASNDIRVGNRAEMTPSHNASIWVRQQLFAHFSAGLGLLAHSEQYALTDNSVRLPGYARADLVLTYQQPRYDVSLKLSNIGNTRYMESANNNVQIQPGAPFNVSLVVNTRF